MHQWHLLPRIVRYFYLTVRSSQSNDPKIKIQKLKFHRLPTSFHLFSHIKGEMRDSERKKRSEIERERRDQIEEIKIEILTFKNGFEVFSVLLSVFFL
jgi:hypothetical protein